MAPLTRGRGLDQLRSILAAARDAGIQVFFVPHRRWEPGDYEDWDHPNPCQRAVQKRQTFAKGSWGGEWHPDFVPQACDVVVKEHWAKAASPVRISIFNSSSTASRMSSPSVCSPTPAVSPPAAWPWSWDIT
jgi:hypothetical protein